MNKLKYSVSEEFIQSKSGELSTCEDKIFYNDKFIAVIDGATTKIDFKWDIGTPGQVAANLISEALVNLPIDADITLFIKKTNDLFTNFYKSKGIISTVHIKPHYRVTASAIVVSLFHKEIWLIGDCKGLIDEQPIENPKKIDEILSLTRSAYLESELIEKNNLSELLVNDKGREYIKPLLINQYKFQNKIESIFGYSALDGFSIPMELVLIKNIPENTKTIVLSSDGYPKLFRNLADSENFLNELLENDPLMYKFFPQTKGKQPNCESFDDRSFLKINLFWE